MFWSTCRRASAGRCSWILGVLLLGLTPSPGEANPYDDGILYILPVYLEYLTAGDAVFSAEAQRLRERLPQGGPVRLGFTVYVQIEMERWDIASETDAAANLDASIGKLDAAIARARAHNLPIGINLLTAIRDRTDAAQAISQEQDRRVMQWFSDNSLASGWWTLSRYARRQYRVRELYLRAFARILANRMARYPETIVSAAGDAEVELAFKNFGPPLADYSPFAIAEFRDWLRGEGLYAPGQRFASDAFANAARYRGDVSPGQDTNHDGSTVNGDFKTSFSSWDLRYFPWALTDSVDENAIPSSVYLDPAWNRFPDEGAGRFDAPRDQAAVDPAWWAVWQTFREMLVWRYNRDFAAWITTTPDPASGLTVPASRWFSYQIPADYVYGHTPENPDMRYLTSASSWRTADVRPYGGAGTTAFNTTDGVNFFRTLTSVAPLFASLGTRWSILEWNPSSPSTSDPGIYREEMALIERWRPFVVAPYAWQGTAAKVLDSGFEVALVEMIARMRSSPWRFQASAESGRVRASWAPPDTGGAPDAYVIEVGSGPGLSNILMLDTASRSTILDAIGPPGTYYLRVHALRSGVRSGASNEVQLDIPAAPTPPNAPAALTAVTSGRTFTFNWLAPAVGPKPTGYRLEAGSESGRSDLASMHLGPAATFAIDRVPPGSYYVRVRAENAGVAGAASNEVVVNASAGTAHCTPVEPPGPVAYRAVGSRLAFEWPPHFTGGAPTGYRLEAGTRPGLADIATIALGSARTFDAIVPPGTYFLQLRASNSCGTSAPGPAIRLPVP